MDKERTDGLNVEDLLDYAEKYFDPEDGQACLETAIFWAMTSHAAEAKIEGA